MRPTAYLAWLGGTAAGLAVVALSLTIAVDPYRMFGTPTLPGWTELKPRADQQMGIAKTYQLERIAPRTLLLGNSRTEIGLDPASPEWPSAQRPVFNAAQAGRGLFTSLLTLREALAVRPPTSIVMGIDFVDFLGASEAAAEPKPDERRLLVDRDGHANAARQLQVWRDALAVTLSIDAIADSLRTLADQNNETSATMTPLGFNPLHEYRVLVARNGYHALFAQKNAMLRRQYAAYAKPDFADPSLIPSYRYLVAIIRLAREYAIPLTLYIHPYHADYLEMLSDVGLWPSFEAWKRVLVTAIDDAGAGSNVRLFDFSGFHQFSTESVPRPGDLHSVMRWYWEPAHYQRELGEHILAAIFREEPHFGRLLTPGHVQRRAGGDPRGRLNFADRSEARLKGPQTP